MNESVLPLLVVIPLFAGGISLLGKLARGRPAEYVASVLSVATMASGTVVLVILSAPVFSGATLMYSLGGWSEPWGISLRLDGFGWLTCGLVFAVSIPASIYALSRRSYESTFFFFFHVLIAGMISVALTGDLFTMFVSFEIVAIAAYALIAYERTAAGLVASLKYLILSSVGILFFLFGIFLIYRDVGVLSIAAIGDILGRRPSIRDSPTIHFAVSALCVGIGVRTAFIPFHTWLPEAHAYAPHPVSATLSGVLIKVSLFALIRMLLSFGAAYLSDLLLWIGGATALGAVVMALAQTDVKRLLAYHSVSQMGYVLAAFASSRDISIAASLSHAVNHGLFKSLLFLTVGTAITLTGERDVYSIRPVGRRAPLVSLLYFIGALSIAGLPPFNGYASKGFVMQSVAGSPVSVLLWITGAATVASFIKLSRVFMPGPSLPHPVWSSPRPGALTMLSMMGLASACILTGIYAVPLAEVFHTLAGSGNTPYLPGLFTGEKLLTTAATVAAGVCLFFLARSRPGARVSARIRVYAPGVRGVLILFLVGLLGFAAVAYR